MTASSVKCRHTSSRGVSGDARLLCSLRRRSALDTSKLKPTGYVNDFAHVLDPRGAAARSKPTAPIWNAPPACRWRSCWWIRSTDEPDRGRRQPSVPAVGHRQEGQRRRHSAAAGHEGSQAARRSRLWPRADHHGWLRGRRAARHPADSAAGKLRRRAAGRGRSNSAQRSRRRRASRSPGQPTRASASQPTGSSAASRHSVAADLIVGFFCSCGCIGRVSGRRRRRRNGLPDRDDSR